MKDIEVQKTDENKVSDRQLIQLLEGILDKIRNRTRNFSDESRKLLRDSLTCFSEDNFDISGDDMMMVTYLFRGWWFTQLSQN